MKTYQFMAEIADRRTALYKSLNKELDRLVLEYGRKSKEVNDLFNKEYVLIAEKK